MAKEHNLDKIPEHQAYIFFPAGSFVHYDCVEPKRSGIRAKEREDEEITEEQAQVQAQAQEMDRVMSKFCVKGDAEFSELRHLMFTCTGASLGSSSIPKLRSEGLESELKRIFGTVKSANELEDAVLELDCLLPAMKGRTDEASSGFRDAAEAALEVREANRRAAETMMATGDGAQTFKGKEASKAKDRRPNSKSTTNWRDKADSDLADDEGKESTPKKLGGAGIIDGKFVSPNKAPWRKEKGQAAVHSKESTPDKRSPQKYLHPHTFDSVNQQRDTSESEGTHNDTFDSEGATLVA